MIRFCFLSSAFALVSGSVMAEEGASIKVEGTPGVKFLGVCVSADPAKQKNISGTTPAEIDLDLHFQKCSLSAEGKSGEVVVRLFQNRKLVKENQFSSPSVGFEFILPWGSKQPK